MQRWKISFFVVVAARKCCTMLLYVVAQMLCRCVQNVYEMCTDCAESVYLSNSNCGGIHPCKEGGYVQKCTFSRFRVFASCKSSTSTESLHREFYVFKNLEQRFFNFFMNRFCEEIDFRLAKKVVGRTFFISNMTTFGNFFCSWAIVKAGVRNKK